MSHLISIQLRMPADVLADLDAVSPPRGRTRFIVAAMRERLAGEPAAQRARKERAAAIKEKPGTGRELTPAEAAQWWHDVETRNVEVKGSYPLHHLRGRRSARGGASEDLPPEYRKTFGVDTDDPAAKLTDSDCLTRAEVERRCRPQAQAPSIVLDRREGTVPRAVANRTQSQCPLAAVRSRAEWIVDRRRRWALQSLARKSTPNRRP